MKASKWLVRSILVCALIFVGVSSTGLAQEEDTPPTETSITLQTSPLLDDKGETIPGRVLLIATLLTTDGQPVSEHEVSFFEHLEFMGSERNAHLGSGVTDVTGTAVVAYQPSTLEEHSVLARFHSTADYAASDSPMTSVEVVELSPTFESEGVPLEAVRRWLPWAVAVIVLVTWVVVIGALVRAAVGIRAAEAEEQPA